MARVFPASTFGGITARCSESMPAQLGGEGSAGETVKLLSRVTLLKMAKLTFCSALDLQQSIFLRINPDPRNTGSGSEEGQRWPGGRTEGLGGNPREEPALAFWSLESSNNGVFLGLGILSCYLFFKQKKPESLS